MVNLVLTTTSNYVWGAAVTIRAALEHCSGLCNIYILGIDLTSSDERLLENSWQTGKTGKIEFVRFDKRKIDPFRATLHVRSKATHARLFIDECLPGLSRCIFLDPDLIICADLKELYDTDLAGHVAACVCDTATQDESQRDRFEHKLGLKNPSLYFNAGVMLIDLEAWRKHQVQSKAIQICVEMYDSLDSLDQDALNIVLEDSWLKLDQKWNTSKYDAAENFDNGIIHLFGRVKPWHADYNYKFKERFFHILDRTAFASQRPAQLMGLGAAYKKASRFVPTLEMIQGKLRRLSE